MWLSLFILQFILHVEIISSVCQERFSVTKHEDHNEVTSFKNGDYIIQSIQSVSNGDQCNDITIGGLLRIYAVKYALDSVNLDKAILQNITLGWQINDACLSLPIAMSRGIELSNIYRNAACVSNHKGQCVASFSTKPAIAVVGGYYSFTTLPLASLFTLHNIPLISFGASTPLLNKVDLYPSFFRTIPPDTYQVESLVDILLHFNWTYIFAVGSDDDYGKLGIRELKKEASNNNICVTGDVYIPFETSDTTRIAKEIAAKIDKESKATVVVMFNYALGMGEYILKEAEKLNLKRIWLTSEAWNPEVFSVSDIPSNQLESIVTVSLQNGEALPGFKNYVEETVQNNATCDGWLKLFIKVMFNCSITKSSGDRLEGEFCHDSKCENCSVPMKNVTNLIFSENPNQINNLIDAVDAITQALNNITKSNCVNSPCLPDITPDNVTSAMKNVHFQTRRNGTFAFSPTGNPAYIRYSIEQIQWSNNKNVHEYKTIGSWSKQDKLTFDINSIVWPDWTNIQPKSTCSIDCQPGEVVIGKSGCCWECRACLGNFFSNQVNSEECIECPAGYHTVNKQSCIKTPVQYLSIYDAISIVSAVFSIIGIIMTLIAAVSFHSVKNSPYLNSSSSKIIGMSLVLLIVTFAYMFTHIIYPTEPWCQFQYAYFHVLINIYSALLLVMNDSVTRFISKFVNSKEKAHITSITLFMLIQIVEIALVIVWLCVDDIKIQLVDNGTSYLKQCQLDFTVLRMAVFAFPCVVLIIAMIQSLSERNNPSSKNGRFLYFSCFLLCIVNAAYIVTVNYVVGEYQSLVTLLTILGHGFVYMICMVYVTIFKAWTMPSPAKQTDGILNIGFEKAT